MHALTAIALLLATAPGPKRAPAAPAKLPPANVLHLLRASVTVPEDLAVTVAPAAEGRATATVKKGAAVLLLTVYGGASAPNRWAALTAHTDELLARVALGAVSEIQHPLFGRPVTAREVRYARDGATWVARVVAGQKDRHTVVATWTWPASGGEPDADALAALVSDVAVAKGR